MDVFYSTVYCLFIRMMQNSSDVSNLENRLEDEERVYEE